ncbi:ATP synthase subunit I [Alteribacillus iranensis]|uniref:ATP synthase protein I n=1 Tax=Alteribacillus iranensis TaxID=930128 RepID=A0A1I2C193_9BACI|nr:ATP synthase subunit I [Alteribacillus iranensis]SFE61340.1 ATP synthase protein I [Alteribacillus iranensis]
MKTFGENIKEYVQFTLFVMALYVLGFGFTPYEDWFLSLGVGSVIGLFNLWSMYRDVKKTGEAAEQQKAAFTFGMVSRLAAGAVAALLFIRFPEVFRIAGLAGGVMTPYVIILFHSLMQIKRG